MKTCQFEKDGMKCNNPVWSNGFCKNHQRYRTDKRFTDATAKKNAKMDSDTRKERSWVVDAKNDVKMEDRDIIMIPFSKDSDMSLPPHHFFQSGIMTFPRFSSLKPLSKKKQAKKAKIAKDKKESITIFGNKCFLHANREAVDAFHIFPIAKFPEYETEPWNKILSCRECNRTWDQGTWEEINKLPNVKWLFWIIWAKDQDPNKLHKGSFYEQLKNRKDKQ